MAFLRKTDGTRSFPLRPRLTLIGREPGCDITIAQSEVSGRHAIIINQDAHYFIEDLHSLNGTLLNRRAIRERTALANGDTIEFPGLAVTFHEIGTTGTTGLSAMVVPTEPGEPQASILSSVAAIGRPRPDVAPEAKLRAILEISEALGTTLVLDKVLPRILESLFTIFPKATRGFILLRDPETGKLVPKAVYAQGEHGNTLPALSMTVIDQAVETGRAILTVDAGQDARFHSSESIHHLKLHSIMCVPIVGASGTVLGVIQIDTKDSKGIFIQDDLDVLLSASAQAARAIELARMHEEQRDLEAANRIQHNFLPEARPQIRGLEFFDHYSPARQIGGDYFDYITLPGNRLAVTLGDVAGKGISAALLMARLSAAARFCLATTPNVPDAVGRLNNDLARTFGEDRFATFAVAVIDLERFTVTVVNAGHPPPLYCRPGHGPEPIAADNAGLPLSGIPWQYEAKTIRLEPWEAVLFYTDGVTEARNCDGVLYGAERLRGVVRQSPGGVEQIGSAVLADVTRFAAGRSQADDLTLVGFGRTRAS